MMAQPVATQCDGALDAVQLSLEGDSLIYAGVLQCLTMLDCSPMMTGDCSPMMTGALLNILLLPVPSIVVGNDGGPLARWLVPFLFPSIH